MPYFKLSSYQYLDQKRQISMIFNDFTDFCVITLSDNSLYFKGICWQFQPSWRRLREWSHLGTSVGSVSHRFLLSLPWELQNSSELKGCAILYFYCFDCFFKLFSCIWRKFWWSVKLDLVKRMSHEESAIFCANLAYIPHIRQNQTTYCNIKN
jgi:hypothetical protein